MMALVKSYVRSKRKQLKIGMISEIVHLEETATEEEVLNELNRLNNDDSVKWYFGTSTITKTS